MLAVIFIIPIALFGALPLAFVLSILGMPFWTAFWISMVCIIGGGVAKFMVDKKKKESK